MPKFKVHEHKLVCIKVEKTHTSEGGIILTNDIDMTEKLQCVVVGRDSGFNAENEILVQTGAGVPFVHEKVEYLLVHKDQVIVGLYP